MKSHPPVDGEVKCRIKYGQKMRSLDFACPEDVEGLGMTMGRASSPSEPELNISELTTRSYKAAFHITRLMNSLPR
jgi:hypothetical protein